MSRTPSPDFSALSPKEIRKLAAIPDGMLIPPTNPAPSTEEEKARQFIQIFEPVLKAIIDDPYCFDICKTSMPVEQRYQELMMSLAEKRRHQEGLSEAAVAELAKAGKPNLTFTYTDDKGNATVKIFEPTA